MITEPMTMVTDYILAVFVLTWGYRLWRDAVDRGVRSERWWAVGFGAVGLAAIAGGTTHGFRLMLGPGGESALWWATMALIGVFAFSVLLTVAWAGAGGRIRNGIKGLAIVVLVAYLGWISLGSDDFLFAIMVYGLALVVLLVQQVVGHFRSRDVAASWIVAGIAVAVIGSAVQQSGFALHRHFNHNDLYHVIQIVGAWLFYRGGLLLTDRTT
jgi:hypothetical protein